MIEERQCRWIRRKRRKRNAKRDHDSNYCKWLIMRTVVVAT